MSGSLSEIGRYAAEFNEARGEKLVLGTEFILLKKKCVTGAGENNDLDISAHEIVRKRAW